MSGDVQMSGVNGQREVSASTSQQAQRSCFPFFPHTTSAAATTDRTSPGAETVGIARIRPELRVFEKDRFTPSIVQIGPYHNKAQVQPLDRNSAEENKILHFQEEKIWVVNKFLTYILKKRADTMEERETGLNIDLQPAKIVEENEENPELTLDLLRGEIVTEMEELKERARNFYTGDDPRQEVDFVGMMMQDGIFVLYLIVAFEEGSSSHMSTSGYEEITLLRDVVFLLETQIPWLVLKELLKQAGFTDDTLLCERVHTLLANGLYIRDQAKVRPTTESSHLLHLVHIYLAPTKKPLQAVVNIDFQTLRRRANRATLYRKHAYVLFKRREFEEGKVESVLDIALEGRTLLIPCLRIDADTWTILRNLMALEEQMKERPVTAYCVFMSQLARQANDVELLEYEGIIQQFLGNTEDVVQAFSSLCKGVIFNKPSYLDDVWDRLHKRSDKFGNRLMGSFMEKNFGDYVQLFAFLGAVLLLLLQIAQVVLAYLSLHRQR